MGRRKNRRNEKSRKQNDGFVFHRRFWMLRMTWVVVFSLLLGRLAYIQLYSHVPLRDAAVSQYQVLVEGLDTRGAIFDRNMEMLTGGTDNYYYFLDGSRETTVSEDLLQAIGAKAVNQDGSRYSVYRSQYFDARVNTRLKEEFGAYVFSCPSRYSDRQPACHLIGYLNEAEKRGVAGLELRYEDRLSSNGERLTLWADGGGGLLLNTAPHREGGKALADRGLVTTLDKSLQQVCERLLAERQLSGAVLVSEGQSGEILAWASSPIFNPNTVGAYLQSGGSCLVNKAVQAAYPPGSVFKAVVAAAALESGWDPQKKMTCDGHKKIQGVEISCSLGPKEGHGAVDMEEAMAKSCNCYFATTGEEIGYAAILRKATELGLGACVLRDFPGEISGNIPQAGETGQWDITNLSIGQGALLTTPMQLHWMMSQIACRAAGEEAGRLRVTAAERDMRVTDGGGLSVKTAKKMETMLGAVMRNGSGAGYTYACPVYGKTGTAETVLGGKKINQCWFSGYCIIGQTRYVITVLAEDENSGAQAALPVFAEITDYLCSRNYRMS